MPKTVVGLFENPQVADAAVRDIAALGFPVQQVRTIEEPASFEVSSVMSFPRIDFEIELGRELTRIGATIPETQAYIAGLRRGGALAFATGSDEDVSAAGRVMNRLGALEVDEVTGAEPRLPGVAQPSMTPMRDSKVLAGRIREPGGGAAFFVW